MSLLSIHLRRGGLWPVIAAALLVLVLTASAPAQNIATNYTFSQSTGNTYTPITGGTVYGTTSNDDEDWTNIPIGFNFNFNGTVYDRICIQTNGYIVMGATIGGYNYQNPICCGSNDNLISGMFLDLQGQTGSQIMSKLEGTSPNRVFVVQWTNYRNFGAATSLDSFNFQIRLNESALHTIEILYGTMTNGSNYAHLNPPPATVILDPPVGLRGYGNTDYNVRKVSSSLNTWATSTTGTTVNDCCEFTSTFGPPSGLKYKWDLTTIPPPPPPSHWVTIAHPIGSITPGNPAVLISWPVYYFWWSDKSEAIYRDNEFQLGGWSGGDGLITKVGWSVGQTSTYQNGMLYIYFANISNSTASAGVAAGPETPYSNMTLVYSGTSPMFNTFGWKDFELQTPFLYSGEGLLVKVVHDGTAYSTTAYFQATNTGTNPYLHRYAYNDVPAASLTTLPYVYTYRPDIRFDVCIDPNPTVVDCTVPAALEIPATIPIVYSLLDPDDSYTADITFNFRTPAGVLAYSQSTSVAVNAGVLTTGTVNIPSGVLTPGYYVVETVFNVLDYCKGMTNVTVRRVVMILAPGDVPCLVWPGDVNNDVVVNYGDRGALNTYIHDANLSPIWLNGPARYRADAATNPLTYYTWEAQPAIPWQTPMGCYMDADGNGIINNFDYIVIKMNWFRSSGLISPKQNQAGSTITFDLGQNYPNPFNPSTTLDYSVPERSDVLLSVYDMHGREVARLVNSEKASGMHSATFTAQDLPSGQYLARIYITGLESGMTFTRTIKMTLSK
ncbi:MAG: T9SS type A sorting domain-containing protein [Bacteroidota bacterium]